MREMERRPKMCNNKPDARCIGCRNLITCKICEAWLLEAVPPKEG